MRRKEHKAVSTAWQDAFTPPYLQRQDINVVSNFPGGNLSILTLLLLQIGLLNDIHLQGSTGALSSSPLPVPSSSQDWGRRSSRGAGEEVLGCKAETAARARAEEVQPWAGGSVMGWGLHDGLGAQWDIPSSLTSSWGRRLMRILSAFSLSCLLSMRARRSLEALSW